VDEWVLVCVALILLVYAAVSARLQSTVVTQAMVFVAFGLLIGNRVLEVVDIGAANRYVRMLAEATLTLVLFNDAVGVDLKKLRRGSDVPIRLLGIGLPLTIAAGTAAGLVLFPQLDVWTAAALATILAPTDAALGQPIVTNSRLPSRIRQGLNVESGLNDGVCVPLLIIFLTIAQAEERAGDLEPFRIIAEEVGFGVIGGLVAGALGAWVLRTFAALRWMSLIWQQISPVAAALLAYTLTSALGGSGFIAAFVAGITFRLLAHHHAEEAMSFAEETATLLNAATFLIFGAVLLGPALGELEWRIGVYALLSLTAVRMLPTAIAMLGTGTRTATVGFLGWFGPRGLASIVFVLVLVEQTTLAEQSLMLGVVTATVTLSVYAHGISAWPAANRYADWYASQASGVEDLHHTDPATRP